MKDFDSGTRAQRAQQDLGFRIGGEAFKIVTTVPYSIFEFDPEQGDADTITHMNRVIRGHLRSDEDIERWDAMGKRSPADDPLTYGDIKAVYQWLWEVSSDLPTEAPGPSTPGRSTTPATSTGATSSAAEAAT